MCFNLFNVFDMILRGSVVERWVPRFGERWLDGFLVVQCEEGVVKVWLRGSVVQWFQKGDRIKIVCDKVGELKEGFELYRVYMGEVKVWPLFSTEFRLPRLDPVRGEVLYEYRIVAREASTLEDFISIIELEQYHYASRKELVALWRCPDGRIVESNVVPCKGGIPLSLIHI